MCCTHNVPYFGIINRLPGSVKNNIASGFNFDDNQVLGRFGYNVEFDVVVSPIKVANGVALLLQV
jgi:hypothetical protein